MASEAVRTCVACRSQVERGASVRVVLDPAGVPAIDWRGRLPGRGLWCCFRKDCLEGLQKPSRLSRAFKQRVEPALPDWPLAQVRERTLGRQREFVGLASRAGELKSGGNVVERLVHKHWASYLVQSVDSGPAVASKWQERASRSSLPIFRSLLSSEQLGGALGKGGPRSVLAVRKGPLARSLKQELKRGLALI